MYHALRKVKGKPLDVVAETVKKTAFHITRMGQLVAQEASKRLNVPFGVVDLSLAPPLPWETAWPASWRRWAWRPAAPTVPPPPWLF